MKKIIFTLTAFIIAVSSMSAQSSVKATIFGDNTDSDGIRIVSTEHIGTRTKMSDKTPLHFAMAAVVNPAGLTTYHIWLQIHSTTSYAIPDNGALLFKLEDGSIVELNNTTPSDMTRDLVGHSYSDGRTLYWTSASYPVTEDQMHEILEGKITKIRIEVTNGYVDEDYAKADKVSPVLKAEFDLVYETISQKKDVYSDF